MWPTPIASDAGVNSTFGEQGRYIQSKNGTVYRKTANGKPGSLGLSRTVDVKRLVTDKDAREIPAKELNDRRKEAGGQLNADWVERLMGLPDGWTILSPEQADAYVARKKLLKRKDYIDAPPAVVNGLSRSAVLTSWAGDWEAGVPRLAVKQPFRVERLKMLGNGVVPQWALIPVLFIKELIDLEVSNGSSSK